MGHSSFVCTFYFSIVLLAVFILRTRGPGRVRGSVSNLSPVRWGWRAANTVSLHWGKTGGVSDLSIYNLDHWLFVISCSLSIPKQRIALGESGYLWGLYEQEGRFCPLCIATLPDTCSIIVTKTTRRPAACPMCCVSANYKQNYCSRCFCGIIIGSSLSSPPRLWWSWTGW